MYLLTLLACAAQQNLVEDITAPVVIPPGSDYDTRLAVDPTNTGVALRPGIPHVYGTTRLMVLNTSGEPLTCEVWEDALCPVGEAAFAGLEELAPGATWELATGCLLADFACLPAGADDRTRPLRSWSWFVEPDDADAATE